MASKQGHSKPSAPSIRSKSNHGERPGPSALKRKMSLSLFEDLIENSNPKNLRRKANPDQDRNLNDSNVLRSNPKNLHPTTIRGEHNLNDSNVADSQRGAEAANEQNIWLSAGFIRISDNDMVHQNIERNLVSGLNSGGFSTHVNAVYKNGYSSLTSQAKLQSFCVYSTAIKEKCGGDPNVVHAWYGACKNDIIAILAHGFGLPRNNGVYGHGFYLSPVHHPLESFVSSSVDADGLRHMLLCRVILGRVETISPGTPLYNPSSEEFDCGVDNLIHPKKYIIWSTKMNTHVLPEYVVSFRATSRRIIGIRENAIRDSHWIPVVTLINGLSRFLPDHAMKLLLNYLNDYQKRKITRHVMIQRMRFLAGDKLLMSMIKSFGEKMNLFRRSAKGSSRFPQ